MTPAGPVAKSGYAPDRPMAPELYRVTGIRLELADTVTLELEPVNGAVPPFAPGQFNMLYVFGVGEIPISISGDAHEAGVLVHTIRGVGPVSNALCHLKRGDTVGLRGPFGTAWPVAEPEHEGKDLVIMAGGIGLAPLRPAIYYVFRHREKFGRVNLLYGARTPEDILFLEQLEEWRGHLDWTVEVTVDNARAPAPEKTSSKTSASSKTPAESAGERWLGRVGVVTKLVGRALFDSERTLAIICGPEIMMRFSVQELAHAGLSESAMYISMERNMKCAVGFCGHCQYGSSFVCKDGPVFNYAEIKSRLAVREL